MQSTATPKPTRRAVTRRRRVRFRFDRRATGLLLHPTSLPGPHGSGDLGAEARAFADFCAAAKVRWWQMLPVNPPGSPPGNSPYSSTSAFAGSPWLINLDLLREDGLLDRADVQPASSFNGAASVDFAASQKFRRARLRKACEAFDARGGFRDEAFVAFVEDHRDWINDFALYGAIKDAHGGKCWSQWPAPLRLRRPDPLRDARQRYAGGVRFHQFVQFVFDRQWNALKRYCNERGIGLIGDIPIFVAHDSADVWAHRELFLLDAQGRATTVSGYPPDVFNEGGQKWGHPHYNWPAHERSAFAWWVARFAHVLRQFDAARIDHFLGFDRTWHVPARARNARRGQWQGTPGDALFRALRSALGRAQIIAEDLGKVTESAAALRDRYRFPGMRIMQFGFGGGDYHLPHRYVRNCVAYTGTHDNETIAGWFARLQHDAKRSPKGSPQRRELENVRRYVCFDARRDGAIHWALIRTAMMSVADTVVFPVQDVLGLGDEARMNVPGTVDDNWCWRLRPGQLTSSHAAKLAELGDVYGRA
jgi:4-alpha-glucanotransferase